MSSICYQRSKVCTKKQMIFCLFFRDVAYGSSQSRGQIGAAATRLCHSHSNFKSKSHLRPTLQLTVTPDP